MWACMSMALSNMVSVENQKEKSTTKSRSSRLSRRQLGRMELRWYIHFLAIRRDAQRWLRKFLHCRGIEARREFTQYQTLGRNVDYSHIRVNALHTARSGQRQRALVDDFRFALDGHMGHRDEHILRAEGEI